MDFKDDPLGGEHRHYIRLDSVFPVQFCILSLDEKQVFSEWLQGFTNNIGKGGLCLSINNFKPELVNLIKNKEARLSLNIEMPIAARPILASARVIWVKDAREPGRYFIGLSYEQIAPSARNRIIRYAKAKKFFTPFVITAIIILSSALMMNSYFNIRLIRGNKLLVGQLVKVLQEFNVAKETIEKINREKEDLQSGIQALHQRIQVFEEEKLAFQQKAESQKMQPQENVKFDESKITRQLADINSVIVKLTQEKNSLQEKLIVIQRKESIVNEELSRLDKKKVSLEKANLDKMYQWLVIHQNPRTGLLMSFEGDNDIANWAFIYDQSLVTQAYANFFDFEKAKKILDFFDKKAKRSDGLFFNAYYAGDGQPAEYVVHSGPNIWIGIAVLQYTQKSKDKSFIKLAEEIASAIINLQNQDNDSGIRGGPNVGWYSTEHNLDAYAFFNMLYKITGKNKYLEARDKVLNWLKRHTYDRAEVPIKRGRGDSTIATDTYAWSIAAIGPEKLEDVGMNPDMIIEFAEQNCGTEVSYQRPEGQTVKIKGFDFAAQRHVARGGVVSSEWTAQMVMAYKIMADFYNKKGVVSKAKSYRLKAEEYLMGLGNMVISSPSPSGQGESCLPYATEDFVDTGHGWMTPKGKSTGSVAGTAYTLFAHSDYNPLSI